MKEVTERLTVKYKALKRIVRALADRNFSNDDEVTFEYIVGSCFPDALKKIKEEMRRQYTMGYTDGLKENKTSE